MSFILDALKKSEIERQRQTVPGLMDTRMSRGRGRLPLWALALAVLLGVNLLVLTWVLWRKAAPVPAPPAAAAPVRTEASPPEVSPTARTDHSPPAAEHFSPLDAAPAAPVYAPEIPVAVAENSAPLRPSDRVGSKPGGSANAAGRPAHHADPVLTDDDDGNQEVLPSISEISLSGAQALPELHIDVHVYATNPAERFVYINMRKYHEGSPLQEGPLIERIRRDGVVLRYQGLRFLLPRQP